MYNMFFFNILVIFLITSLVTSATGQVIEFDASLNDTLYIDVRM